MNFLPYDDTNPISIERYAKRLIGHTFLDVLKSEISTSTNTYGDKARKGGLGNLLEEVYFRYKVNSDSRPDFYKAGVELKATPYEIKENGSVSAGERVVLTMISYEHEMESSLLESHLWEKCRLILFIIYLRDRKLFDNLLYKIEHVSLFTPPVADILIMKSDYAYIAKMIQDGKAHELSEADTQYLGACTKGATAEKSTVPQFYGEHIPARKRAFCYKQHYMTVIIRDYIIRHRQAHDSIIQDSNELLTKSFGEIITERINRFIGWIDREIGKYFGFEDRNFKSKWAYLAYRMLGVKSNGAEEFEKANIKIKAIRVEKDGTIREHMSFPTYRYCDLVKEEWETSTLREYFEQTKFFFVVFKNDGADYRLQGCKLWNMPHGDLEYEVRSGWQNIVDVIKHGVELTYDGQIVFNNLPKIRDNRIIHTRPHAQKTYYEFNDGVHIGDPENKKYSNPLPNGFWMPNHCFWLNKEYIQEQISELL